MSAANSTTLPTSAADGEPRQSSKPVDHFATLAAKLALRGLQLHELSGGGWLISDHRTSLHAPDLRAVARFIDCGH